MTPVLSFSEVAIAGNVRLLHEFAVEADRCWAAALTRIVPIRLLRDLILPVTKLAACSRVYDAEHLADAGFEKIILTGRVVDAESLGRLGNVAQRTQMIVVIDHFRHAELLSPCAIQSNCEIQVLIEVDLGRQSTGVRPGPDASLLAAATSLLPGLRVIGVFASAMHCDPEHDAGETDEGITSIVTIATHALRSIRDVTAESCEVVVSVSSSRSPSMQDARISCLVASPFIDLTGHSQKAVHQPCVSVVATVISRPTLEWCVINAGTNTLGDVSDVYVSAPSGATIHHSTSETSTLLVSGAACDLRIGDLVRLGVRNFARIQPRVWFAS